MCNKFTKFAVLFICVIFVSASAVPTVYASSAKTIGVNVPIEIGKPIFLFADASKGNAPKCPSDPKAPCYIEPWKQATAISAPSVMNVASDQQYISCGVNVKNKLNQTVAQLWTTVKVSWNDPTQYHFNALDAYYGIWVASGGIYGWTNLAGPTSHGARMGGQLYSGAPYYYTSTGTVTYLGIGWVNASATVKIIGWHNFSCQY